MNTAESDADKSKALQAAHSLWQRYQPEHAPYAFRETELSAARQWQARSRDALGRLLGLDRIATAPLSAQKLETIDKGDYIREKVLLRTAEHTLMPVYILLPKERPEPLPVVLALHGHGYGVKDIVGLWEDGQERDSPDGYHQDFAVALCRAGFAVAAPEILCFGERRSDFSYLDARLGQPEPTSCAHAAQLAFHLGTSVAGLRVHDTRRLIDYLESREELDAARLGAMGISGGGMLAFFSTCLDERIRACVISGYFSTFRDSILAMSHCACNVVPGLAQFGEMYDLVGLIAPRPLLVEAGSRDPIFPFEAVKQSVGRAQEVYEVFAARQEVHTDYFEGRHRVSGQRAYAFLQTCLERPPA